MTQTPFPTDIDAAQERVVTICHRHYPGESVAKKVINLIEEAVELGMVIGVAPEAMRRAMDLTIAKSDDPVGDPDATRKEIGDVVLSAFAVAGILGLSSRDALAEVMAVIEARDPADSAARSARKVAMGITEV